MSGVDELALQARLARLKVEVSRIEAVLAADPGREREAPPCRVKSPDGTVFLGLADAARQEGVSIQVIHQRIKRGISGWRYADEHDGEDG